MKGTASSRVEQRSKKRERGRDRQVFIPMANLLFNVKKIADFVIKLKTASRYLLPFGKMSLSIFDNRTPHSHSLD
jgi:hypothetical protein